MVSLATLGFTQIRLLEPPHFHDSQEWSSAQNRHPIRLLQNLRGLLYQLVHATNFHLFILVPREQLEQSKKNMSDCLIYVYTVATVYTWYIYIPLGIYIYCILLSGSQERTVNLSVYTPNIWLSWASSSWTKTLAYAGPWPALSPVFSMTRTVGYAFCERFLSKRPAAGFRRCAALIHFISVQLTFRNQASS